MLRRRIGRPGLLGAIARTAVVAGTATMTANAVNRRAQSRAEEQQEAALYEQQVAAAPPPPRPVAPDPTRGATLDDVVERLTRLSGLHESGALTDDEFAAAKHQLLDH